MLSRSVNGCLSLRGDKFESSWQKGNSEGGETKADIVKPLWSEGETQSDPPWKIDFRVNAINALVTGLVQTLLLCSLLIVLKIKTTQIGAHLLSNRGFCSVFPRRMGLPVQFCFWVFWGFEL